jgi:hypothetical protein
LIVEFVAEGNSKPKLSVSPYLLLEFCPKASTLQPLNKIFDFVDRNVLLPGSFIVFGDTLINTFGPFIKSEVKDPDKESF